MKSRVFRKLEMQESKDEKDKALSSMVQKLIMLLFFLFTSLSCSGQRTFSAAQLQKDENLYSKEINKRIELHTQNGDVINGFLTAVRDDSVAISSEEVDPKPRRIAKADIKYFYIYDESSVRSGGALVTVYAVLCAWFAIFLFRK